MSRVKIFAWIGVAGAVWGLVFAALSTLDYASHLDRGLHDLHCSFIPGVEVAGGEEGCRTALNSRYAALFKTALWGGVPISAFGLGCFAYLLGHAFFMANSQEPTRARALLYAALAVSPALVSAIMFGISWFELGAICKTCVGIYLASVALAVSGIGLLRATSQQGSSGVPLSARAGALGAGALGAMLLFVLTPSAVYAALAPDHSARVTECGALDASKAGHDALVSLPGSAGSRSALFFEDPLCPTCKSLHERLRDAGALGRLNVELALLPLDSECNWMLQQPVHPGACSLSKAVLCAKAPGEMLDWIYEHQAELAEAGRASPALLEQKVARRFGAELTRCMGARATRLRLERHLRFAVNQKVALSTPQVFIEGQRLCDEDIDMGLMFALDHLAPELLP